MTSISAFNGTDMYQGNIIQVLLAMDDYSQLNSMIYN